MAAQSHSNLPFHLPANTFLVLHCLLSFPFFSSVTPFQPFLPLSLSSPPPESACGLVESSAAFPIVQGSQRRIVSVGAWRGRFFYLSHSLSPHSAVSSSPYTTIFFFFFFCSSLYHYIFIFILFFAHFHSHFPFFFILLFSLSYRFTFHLHSFFSLFFVFMLF